MNAWADSAALTLSCCGLIVLALASLLQGNWRAGAEMALSIWLAAVLIRLAGLRSWQNLAGAAVILLVRYMVSLVFRRTRPPRAKLPGAEVA